MSAIPKPPSNHLASDLCANGGRLEPGSNLNSSVSVIQCSALIVRRIDLPCWLKLCSLLLLDVLTCICRYCFFISFYFCKTTSPVSSPAAEVVGYMFFLLPSVNKPLAGGAFHTQASIDVNAQPYLDKCGS